MSESNEDETKPAKGLGLFYKLALAGVGGVMLAQEEIGNFLRRDGQKAPPEEPSSDQGVPLGDATADRVDATITRVLATFNVPSRADVDDLTARIAELIAQVEALETQRG